MFLDLLMAASIEYVSKTWFADNAPKPLLFPDEMKRNDIGSSGKHVKRPHRKHSRGPGSLGGLELPSLKPELISQ